MSYQRKEWEKRNKGKKGHKKGQRFQEGNDRQDKGNDRQQAKQALKRAA